MCDYDIVKRLQLIDLLMKMLVGLRKLRRPFPHARLQLFSSLL